jgi:hypothetical protein
MTAVGVKPVASGVSAVGEEGVQEVRTSKSRANLALREARRC